CCFPSLIHHRHGELWTGIAIIRPTAGDRLGLGVEAEGVWSMLVQVTETRGLPTAEGVVSNWHWDRHVDANHADVDLGCKIPCRSIVRRKDCHSVAVLVFGRKLHGFF